MLVMFSRHLVQKPLLHELGHAVSYRLLCPISLLGVIILHKEPDTQFVYGVAAPSHVKVYIDDKALPLEEAANSVKGIGQALDFALLGENS